MMDDDEGKKKKKSSWRILEFYSGIGGMRYSVMKAGIEGAEIVEAFDINDKANDVYQHNFGHRPSQGNIQTLTSVELDNYGADAWLMSPPCQPYTRQGLQKHSADARASSFIKIIELIPQMLHPPSMLFVENVVGFETSDTHMQLLKILSENSFATQEFILSPLEDLITECDILDEVRVDFSVKAKRNPLTFKNPSFNGQLLLTPVPFVTHARTYSPYEEKVECESIKAYLQNTDTIGKQLKNKECDDSLEDVEENNFDGKADRFIVPPNLIDRWGSAMDVVFPDSKRCCCFTKSYYRYVKGTGSLLATAQSGSMKKSTISSLKQLDLRYFTPREVANLHSFPEDFDFPSHVSLRQRYAMLGNSLSVAVVSPLLHYLFSEDFLTC